MAALPAPCSPARSCETARACAWCRAPSGRPASAASTSSWARRPTASTAAEPAGQCRATARRSCENAESGWRRSAGGGRVRAPSKACSYAETRVDREARTGGDTGIAVLQARDGRASCRRGIHRETVRGVKAARSWHGCIDYKWIFVADFAQSSTCCIVWSRKLRHPSQRGWVIVGQNLHMIPAAESDAVNSLAPREARALHRIGAVSRLAAVPVTTLRVWETRYAAFAPAKTAGSHRLYDEADVARARVLRQLTERGHSIGGIARLPLDDLQRLLERTREAEARTAPVAPDRQVTAVVVGAALAARLDAPGVQDSVAAQLRVVQVYADLDEADADETPAAGAGGKVVLLARMNIVHDSHHAQLLRLIDRSGATGAVVLYNYGAPPALEALRAAGLVVRREPVPAPDFAQLIRSMLYVG
ncbi:MAG: MerR family transcriptional regulator, partial [Comamonadaceae bacterium]